MKLYATAFVTLLLTPFLPSAKAAALVTVVVISCVVWKMGGDYLKQTK